MSQEQNKHPETANRLQRIVICGLMAMLLSFCKEETKSRFENENLFIPYDEKVPSKTLTEEKIVKGIVVDSMVHPGGYNFGEYYFTTYHVKVGEKLFSVPPYDSDFPKHYQIGDSLLITIWVYKDGTIYTAY